MSTTTIQPFSLPGDIERRSFEIIDAEVPEPRPFQGREWEIARRLIHTSADFEMLDLVRFHPRAVDAGVEALRSGCLVLTDTEMARSGIPPRRMEPLGCRVESLMGDQRAAVSAKEQGTTRSAAAMRLARGRLAGSIVAIGNAPTALLTLLELLDQGETTRSMAPALVVGMCVGFVNAAESKALLAERDDVPWIVITGRKGGSPLAAATVNALAELALSGR
jgi:precorrin-8X/cobalt-precorrin-8 methylmutase